MDLYEEQLRPPGPTVSFDETFPPAEARCRVQRTSPPPGRREHGSTRVPANGGIEFMSASQCGRWRHVAVTTERTSGCRTSPHHMRLAEGLPSRTEKIRVVLGRNTHRPRCVVRLFLTLRGFADPEALEPTPAHGQLASHGRRCRRAERVQSANVSIREDVPDPIDIYPHLRTGSPGETPQ